MLDILDSLQIFPTECLLCIYPNKTELIQIIFGFFVKVQKSHLNPTIQGEMGYLFPSYPYMIPSY